MPRKRKPPRDKTLAKLDRLFWKKAWRTWHQLPQQAKACTDVEDLYAEAYLTACQLYAKWNPARSSFMTIAYITVDNRMKNILLYWQCKMRTGITVELEKVDYERADAEAIDPPDPVTQALAACVQRADAQLPDAVMQGVFTWQLKHART